ncbi:hypothetical protein KM043_000751 [Ampulex compressa]|nr:hypothetical protein KM043_000751 [Ampulex compressa]
MQQQRHWGRGVAAAEAAEASAGWERIRPALSPVARTTNRVRPCIPPPCRAARRVFIRGPPLSLAALSSRPKTVRCSADPATSARGPPQARLAALGDRSRDAVSPRHEEDARRVLPPRRPRGAFTPPLSPPTADRRHEHLLVHRSEYRIDSSRSATRAERRTSLRAP